MKLTRKELIQIRIEDLKSSLGELQELSGEEIERTKFTIKATIDILKELIKNEN